MEEAPENSKESPHSVHANGLIDMTITQSCLSYGPLVQILTENNREERKTSSQIAEEITILRSKKE